MSIQPNSAHRCTLLNNSDSQQLIDAINASLCKAEALAITAVSIDFEAYHADIVSNYLWALSGLIQDARKFLRQLSERDF